MGRGRGKGRDKGSDISDSHSYVIGRNPVSEMLRTQAERIVEVLVVEHVEGSSERAQQLLSEIRSKGIKIRFLPKEKLDALVGMSSHQSFVAVVQGHRNQDLDLFLEEQGQQSSSLIVALDAVSDPHNLGAILRAAECFGADGVLWSRNRGAQISAVVSKVSAGASELVNSFEIGNLVETVKRLKEAGYWAVGAAVGPEMQPSTTFKFPEKTLLILGSEGEGLRSLVEKHLDFAVAIPMLGQIDSLNVSQAAAVLLYAYRLQHPGRTPHLI